MQVFRGMKRMTMQDSLTVLDESLPLVIGKWFILVHFFKNKKW
jgi:hypothetical protein